jgi:hypothetical protein
MTEDTFARRLAKLIGRVEGMTADMTADMDDIRQRLLALDAHDQPLSLTDIALHLSILIARMDAEELDRLAVRRAWAQRLEQHSNDLQHLQLGVTEPQALLYIIDRLDALRHDMEEAGS